MNIRTDEEMLKRLAAYNLQKHDYVFGIAITSSVLLSMMRAFVASSTEKTPEMIEVFLDNLEVMMHAMAQGSGANHIQTGQQKSAVLMEEVFRIVKLESTTPQ